MDPYFLGWGQTIIPQGLVASKGEGHTSQGETLRLQQLVENIDKATTNPNKCLICLCVLSCQSSLKMHYHTNTGERLSLGRSVIEPSPPKATCRDFSAHQINTPIKTQSPCPISQRKFTNAVILQQRIPMHMGSQIPSAPLLENRCDCKGPEPMAVGENGSMSVICHNNIVESISVDDAGSQNAPQQLLEGP